jgi:hypothetical protein
VAGEEKEAAAVPRAKRQRAGECCATACGHAPSWLTVPARR